MRADEIEFRGKETCSKKWVYGHFCKDDDDKYVISFWERPVFLTNAEVFPETVGQYTGIKYRTGEKVYEGDIVKWRNISGLEDGKGQVVWDSDYCGFYIIDKEDGIFCESLYDFTQYRAFMGKKIGNIHDNPELLKGEEC